MPGSPVSLVVPDSSDEDARWLEQVRAAEANRREVDTFFEQTGKLPWDKDVRTAYHESGHCLWYYHNKKHFIDVTIVPDRWSEGRVRLAPIRPTQERQQEQEIARVIDAMEWRPQSETNALREAELCISGIAAECVLLSMARPSNDIEINKARTFLSYLWPPIVADYVFDVTWRRLCKRWAAPINWAAIDALARTLLRRKTLSYAGACVIIDAARHSKMSELGYPVTKSDAIPA